MEFACSSLDNEAGGGNDLWPFYWVAFEEDVKRVITTTAACQAILRDCLLLGRYREFCRARPEGSVKIQGDANKKPGSN